MSLTPSQIAQGLIDLTRDLDALVKEFKSLGANAAKAKRSAETAYARAYMESEGPVEERKQSALLKASDERFQADLAEREVAGCKEALRAIHARIEVGRTLSATTRDELKTLGVSA
ncbi:hypothetical protein ACIBEJ_34670 [Nonomuraea sp. NPDC050790]|uniref:hypothetical protein n=1 Tax=Nonomuraea sp. NPDC050790 TaxID=3364371 RepID=UPI0037A76F55